MFNISNNSRSTYHVNYNNVNYLPCQLLRNNLDKTHFYKIWTIRRVCKGVVVKAVEP